MSSDQSDSDVVMDLMEKGPSDNAYAELKPTYLERRTPTTAERVQRLHALGPLGDQRPYDLLRMIERILGRTVQGDKIATEEFLTSFLNESNYSSVHKPTFYCGTDGKNG